MSMSKAVQAPNGVGDCVSCNRRYVLTIGGLVRAHGPRGAGRCVGSGRPPVRVIGGPQVGRPVRTVQATGGLL